MIKYTNNTAPSTGKIAATKRTPQQGRARAAAIRAEIVKYINADKERAYCAEEFRIMLADHFIDISSKEVSAALALLVVKKGIAEFEHKTHELTYHAVESTAASEQDAAQGVKQPATADLVRGDILRSRIMDFLKRYSDGGFTIDAIDRVLYDVTGVPVSREELNAALIALHASGLIMSRDSLGEILYQARPERTCLRKPQPVSTEPSQTEVYSSELFMRIQSNVLRILNSPPGMARSANSLMVILLDEMDGFTSEELRTVLSELTRMHLVSCQLRGDVCNYYVAPTQHMQAVQESSAKPANGITLELVNFTGRVRLVNGGLVIEQ